MASSAPSVKPTALWDFINRYAVIILALLVLAVIPFSLGIFRLGLAAKYLSFAFCAVGIVLIWGGGMITMQRSCRSSARNWTAKRWLG